MTEEKNKVFAVRCYLFLLLLLPNIYTVIASSDLSYSLPKKIAYFAVVLVCLLLPAFVLKARAYFIFEGIFSLFAAPIEIASIHLNRSTASTTFLSLVYQTDIGEATELLSSLWLIVVAMILMWVSYFYFAIKQDNKWLILGKMRWWVIGSIPMLLLAGGIVFTAYAKRLYNQTTVKGIASIATDIALMKFHKIYPYDFYINTYYILQEKKEIAEHNRALESFRFGISEKTDTVPSICLLVIGETARSMNFSLNGYERQTNPLLEKRSNIVSYAHAYSQANLTQYAVPHILSRIPATNQDSLFKEKSMVEAFAESGGCTYWISNQHAGAYLDRVIQTVDYAYTSTKDMTNVDNYDIILVDKLCEYLSHLKDNRKLIVIHSLGSHWRYDMRYTDDFALWKPAISSNSGYSVIQPDNRNQLLNAYDNSILYTDYFLDSIISVLESTHQPAFMLYLSDHGENLYDDERQLVFHGSYYGTEYEYNIPFIVWYSEQFAALYPEKVESLRINKDKRFNSEVVFHTLLNAAGIEQATDTNKSLVYSTMQDRDTLYALTGGSEVAMFTKEDKSSD